MNTIINFRNEHDRAPEDVTHFLDGDYEQRRTLCGRAWEGIVWRNDLRADCERCQDVWMKRTDWELPLPELVV